MLEYLAMLLVISLVLIAIFSFVKNRIPLRPQIIYGTVGVSFALGAIFPMAISTLTPGQVLTIYFGLIALSATALSYAESRVSLNVSPTPVKVADLEPENIPAELVEGSFSGVLQANIATLEACATLDNSTETGESDEPIAAQSPGAGLPVHVEDMPAADKSTAARDLTAVEDKHEREVLPVEEELSLNAGVFVEEALHINEEPFKEEPSVKTDLPEFTDALFDINEKLPEAEEELFNVSRGLPEAGEECPAQEDLSSHEKVPADEKLPEQSNIVVVEEIPVVVEELPVIDEKPVIAKELPVIAEEFSDVLEEPPVTVEEPPLHKEQSVSVYEDPVIEESPPPQYGDTGDTTEEAPLEQAAAATGAVGTYSCEEQFTSIREEIKEPDAALIKTGTGTVNDYISAGFEAKARGNPAGAAEYFFKALHLNQGQQISAALALEISAAYQELGQYLQAGMILKSVMEQEDSFFDSSLRQRLQGQLVYLETLAELLRIAKMPNAPYSRIPNLIKIKANIETAERLKEITKGGRVSEKQPADFRATGS